MTGSANDIVLNSAKTHAYVTGHSLSGSTKDAVVMRMDITGTLNFIKKVTAESG